MLLKHNSPGANTSNPLFNCPHALTTHSTQCQHLKPPFQLPPCPQNTFHRVPTPQTPFSTAPMPSKHNSPSANTSNPLFNTPHALKTHLTYCQHLKPPFQLPPCPQNTFHPVPAPEAPFASAPMPSKHSSPSANTWQPAALPSKQRTLYCGGTTLTSFVTMHLCSSLLTLRSAGGSTHCHAQGADMGCKTNRKKQAATTSI